ncbi:MAG: trehalose-phosphatase [Hyphomicrobiales bacterium]|nr:trehalose-phosphatase [Hyphomicrobiales bacterium]
MRRTGIADGATAAFFIDFDGTLVEIASAPDAIVTPPGLAELLADLTRRTGGAVAVLSGRSLATIDRMLTPTVLAGCGQHGLELRLPGGASVAREVAEMEPIRRRLAAVSVDWPEGVTIEDKGLSIAVHYRAAPQAAERVEDAVGRAVAQAPGTFRLRRGKMVVEATLAGASKGTALKRLMVEPPFLGRTPVVLGDDVTDDDAFDAARAFGGTSFQVGPREGHRADFEIDGPSGVLDLLRDFAQGVTSSERTTA